MYCEIVITQVEEPMKNHARIWLSVGNSVCEHAARASVCVCVRGVCVRGVCVRGVCVRGVCA